MRATALLSLLLCTLLPSLAQAADDDSTYQMTWIIALEPGNDWAEITLEVADGRPVRDVRFSFDPERFRDFEAEGKLAVDDKDHSVHWEPARENASLSYRARITRSRANQNQDESYDALMTDDWALFRGDRVIPRMSVTMRKGVEAETKLRFELPDGWGAVTGWPRDQSSREKPRYFVDDPERRFDRPTGWMMAGRLGTRRDRVGSTEFSIAAPRDSMADRGSCGMNWKRPSGKCRPRSSWSVAMTPCGVVACRGPIRSTSTAVAVPSARTAAARWYTNSSMWSRASAVATATTGLPKAWRNTTASNSCTAPAA
jgi:hypothetical protein